MRALLQRLRALLRHGYRAETPHEWCRKCGGPNVGWSCESPLWNLVMRDGSINGDPIYSDLVCIACFIGLAQRAGVLGAKWRLTVRDMPAEVETVTPSGRVWDKQRWLWVTP